jgi:hypothetical protein
MCPWYGFRRAGLLHRGQATSVNEGVLASGLPEPSGTRSSEATPGAGRRAPELRRIRHNKQGEWDNPSSAGANSQSRNR